MNCAVVVPHGGVALAEECRRSVEQYCDRFALTAVFLSEAKVHAKGPGTYPYGRFEKFQVERVFDQFDRVLLLDADTLITHHAPNVFDEVPVDEIGAVREDVYRITKSRRRGIRQIQDVMGELDWHKLMFNSGVIVASRMHRKLWETGDELNRTLLDQRLGKYKEQKIVNWRARKFGFAIKWLDPRWNFLRMYEMKLGLDRTESFIIHYAGRTNRRLKRRADARMLGLC